MNEWVSIKTGMHFEESKNRNTYTAACMSFRREEQNAVKPAMTQCTMKMRKNGTWFSLQAWLINALWCTTASNKCMLLTFLLSYFFRNANVIPKKTTTKFHKANAIISKTVTAIWKRSSKLVVACYFISRFCAIPAKLCNHRYRIALCSMQNLYSKKKPLFDSTIHRAYYRSYSSVYFTFILI